MYNNNLNYTQYRSITSKYKFNIIIAGAGSGKTRVIINRIGWLIKKNKISENHICAITFTNKAAIEMRIRLNLLLKKKINNTYLGTFHSLSYRILYFYYKFYKYDGKFQVIDDSEQLSIIRSIISKYKLEDIKHDIRFIQSFINKKKNQGIRFTNIYNKGNSLKYLYNIYNIYEVFCNKNMLLDFSEIILRSYEILSYNYRLRNIYQKTFSYVLIDEFQDTNNIQYEWFKILTFKSKSVSVVCDDDQLIYGWRGANIDNISLFKKEYRNVSIFYLEQNYRSNTDIISLANSIIKNNKKRFEKNLWSLRKKTNNIKIYQAKDEINECYYIIHEIYKLKAKKIKLGNICILYRSKYQARIIEEYFLKENIAYTIRGKKSFF